MKKSFPDSLRKLLVLTALLALLAALMCGCETKDPTDETVNNLPDTSESEAPTKEPTAPPTEEPTTPPEDVIMGTVTTDNLNIRSNPSIDSTVITQLAVSTRVEIFERKTVNGVPWGRIEQGWINLNYVAIDGEDNIPDPTEPEATTPPVSDPDDQDEEPAAGSGTTGTITASELNIREGAGSSYDVVGKYKKGDKVTILETKNGWGRTSKGWISMNYVETSGSTGSAGSTSTTGTATITADALYIREGAGSSYDAVGKYHKGDKVTILETKNGWGKTDKGWIYLEYVSGYNGSTGSTSTSGSASNFTGAGTVTTALNIREGAGSSYDKVGEYAEGTKVTILEAKNGWGKTDKGWISLKYVKADSSSSSTTGKTGTGTITASTLYIREGAGTSYDAVGSYKKGDTVTILETKDGWGKTDKGWISLKYVDMD